MSATLDPSAVPKADDTFVVPADFRARKWTDRIAAGFFWGAAASSILITLGIVGILVFESADFFAHVSLWEFLTSRTWDPLTPGPGESGYDPAYPPHFGILPLLCGTLVTTGVA